MPDISKVNGVEVGNISKVDNAETGNINTLLSGSFPAQQSDPANVDMTSGDNDHPNGTSQTWGPAATVASISGTEYLVVAYGDDGDGDKPKVRVATWNGSALSWGDETTIRTTGSSYANGICFDPNTNRVFGSCMQSGGGGYNDYFAYAAGIATSGSGAPKLENVDDVSDVYHPSDDGGSSTYNQTGKHVGNMIYDDNTDRALMFFEKGGPESGSSHGGDNNDFVVCSVTLDDVSSNNNITVSDLSVVKDEGDHGYASYDQLRNRIVYLTQDESGTYQAEAGTITGSGATHTVASPTQYADQSVINHRQFNAGSSLPSNTMDTHQQTIVFDDTNNVHHVLMWDDVVDDWIVTNFSVGSDNSITWATSNGEPLRSNGLVTQFGGDMTQGKTSGWTNSHGDGQPYFSICIGYSSKRGRLVITGPSTAASSSNTQRAVGLVYSPTTGYNYTGNYHTILTNAQGGGGYQIATPSGSHATDETFLDGGVVFFHYRQNTTSGYQGTVYGYDPGVGQRTASGGIFSAGNATLSTARTRCAGLGTSRIASMVVGGQNTSSSVQNTGEEYNGSTVTAAGDTLSAAKNQPGACGTLTAGLVQGGNNYLTSDEYDGTNFTSGGTASTVGGDGNRAAGLQTDALVTGGYVSSYRDDSESYNGTSFTTEADTPATTNYHAMAGTGHEDAYCFLGTDSGGSATNQTFNYNGTSWSTLNTAPNSINSFLGGGTGEDFLVVLKGSNASIIWDGTNWASGSTNGVSSLDFYSGTSDTDCSGTSAWVAFGGGTGSGQSTGQATITHHDR
jgi:hypothetical protein